MVSSPALDPAHVAATEAAIGRANRDRLLIMLADQARRAPAEIADALAAGGLERARAEAHALRGALGAFGAERLAAVLHRIEHGDAPADALGDLRREAEAVARAAEALLKA